MSGTSIPISRPVGKALIVGNSACRGAPRASLSRMGFQCAELEDPYAAMAELCQRPLVYRALIISLNSLFTEELIFIATIKKRFSHIDIWLTDMEGRQSALAEALRLGADGLLADDGLHRISGPRLGGQVTDESLGPEVELEEAPPDEPITPPTPQPTDPAVRSPSASARPVDRAIDNPRENSENMIAKDKPADQPDDRYQLGTMDHPMGEPILTAEELRALLQDQPDF